MISIIICSANEADLNKVKENISLTIGVPHEIIAFNNADGKKGICEVYNSGTRQSKYDILCFMHEDIALQTLNWGDKVLQIFQSDPNLGLLAVAGGGYKSLTPSSWYNYDLEENGGFYCNLIQGYKYTGKPDEHDYRNPKDEKLSYVACVDGCWLCIPKKVALQFPFDQKLLQKFHGYDLDFSISISKSYKAAVTFEVLLKHFSEGKFDKLWMDEIIKVHKKWSQVLPVNVDRLPENRLKQIERNAFEHFLKRSLKMGYYSKWELTSIIWNAGKSRIATLSFPFKLIRKLWKIQPETPD